MVRIRLSDLDETVKAFLAPAQKGETIVVEDDDGRVQCGVTPFIQATSAEKQAWWAVLERLQKRSAKAMAELGVTEADVDQELQD